MFKPTKKQISAFIGSTVLIGIVALLAYAAVFFAPSKQPIGYVSQPDLSNYNVASGNSKVYRGLYNNYDWSGQFTCYPVTSVGYVNLSSPCFLSGASSPLDTQAAANTRLIGTLSDSTTSPVGVEFSTTGLTTAQQTALVTTANINWLRGQAQTGLRTRTTVLGDIIHSRPYYWPDTLANNYANPTVFVGANDGMLHAFNANNGQERWAYVPSMLIPKMSALTSSTYTGTAHDYYVDGNVTIANVTIAGTATPVLVGALGAGGQGLYALNISTLAPTTGQAVGQKALWEITPSSVAYNGTRTNSTCTAGAATAPTGSYCNMGYTYSNPIIVPTEDGNTSVIVGNGYNNTGNGHATLYVINAATGALIQEIDTGSGSTTSPNGLSSPTAVDINGKGKADRVYAGDINGNMWVFDLSNTSSGSWKVAFGTTGSPQPLYSIPQGTATEPIAITQAPVISVHPYGGFMVNFATGRLLSGSGAAQISPSTSTAIDDTADTTTPYAAYGLWDNLSTTVPSGSLITQTLAVTNYSSTNIGTAPVVQETTNIVPNWTGAGAAGSGPGGTNLPTRGWYVPLYLQGGERVIGDGSSVDSGKFLFNVSNPTVTYTPLGSSSQSTGLNWLFDLDYLSGGPGTTPFIDMNQDGVIDSLDLIGNGTSTAASAIPVAYITSNGVQSQPLLIQLSGARVPLYNQNYNIPSTGPNAGTGVNGGHFDVDVFYNTSGFATAPKCTGGTLSVDGTACVKGTCVGGNLSSTGNACATIPATCTGGTLDSGNTACATVGNYVAAITGVNASCTNGTLNSTSNGCLATTYIPASCTYGGTVSGSSCIASTYSGPSCSNGGTVSGTSCTPNSSSYTGGSCSRGTYNSSTGRCSSGGSYTPPSCSNGGTVSGTTCIPLASTYTGASCSNGGTLNSGKTACMAPSYTGPSCSNGGVVSGSSCKTPTFTAAVAAVPAQCYGGTLNSGSTSCTAPGTYTAASTPGIYATISPAVGTYTAGTSSSFSKVTHVHEYDKRYDTNGLNLLNPNDQTYPLSTVKNMTSSTTYKVLVMNQGWNRAVNLRIGTWSGMARDYQTMLSSDILVASAVSGTYYDNTITGTCSNTASAVAALNVGCLNVGKLPSFTGTTSTVTGASTVPAITPPVDITGKVYVNTVSTTGTIGCQNPLGTNTTSGTCTSATVTPGARATVGGLELSMPFDGYDVKDWWADGDGLKSTGVMPTEPGCAYGDTTTSNSQYVGLGKPFVGRHASVLTVQIISSSTPNSAVQMNVPGYPVYGFRVIDSMISSYVIAEYTLYWHHPSGTCITDTTATAWPPTFTNESPTSGDPWWPAQETIAKTFVGSWLNSTSTTKGVLTCYTTLKVATGPTPTWMSTAYALANTAPYHTPGGTPSTGPAGWTIAPIQDSSSTLPICPSYNAAYDDPRTASFINIQGGANGTGGSSGVPGTTVLSSGMGGISYAAGIDMSSGGGGNTPASGVNTQTSGNTNYQQGTAPVARRITWRELIGL